MTSWDGQVVLTTPRLLLRTWREDDLPLYAALNADPDVVRYLGGPLTREGSDEIAAWAQHVFDTEGSGCSPSSVARTGRSSPGHQCAVPEPRRLPQGARALCRRPVHD